MMMSMVIEQLEKKLQERKEAWWGWHKKNPQVWDKFEEYTLEAIKTGILKPLSFLISFTNILGK